MILNHTMRISLKKSSTIKILLDRLKLHENMASKFSSSARALGVHASLDMHNDVGVVTLHSPGKVNVLNEAVATELGQILAQIQSNSNMVAGVLTSDKPSCFIAGADISMLSKVNSVHEAEQISKESHELLNGLQSLKKPMVAAIMGTCLGGGLEVALACHYRLAVRGMSTFALPEVLLGLLPGAGGTQRLPRLIGLPNALDMMLTGKNVPGHKAKSMGLVDGLIDSLGPGVESSSQRTLNYLKEVAVDTSRNIAKGDLRVKRAPKGLVNKSMKSIMDIKYVRNYIFDQAQKKVMKQTRGLYPAPLKIIEVVKTGLEKGEKFGFSSEARGFGELLSTKESRGLISLFQGQTECKKNPFGESKRKIKTIGVLGAGLMGAGIANVSITKGYTTILNDLNTTNLTNAESEIQKSLQKSVARKRRQAIESEKILANLIPVTNYDKLSKADVIIEAVFEDINIKHKILRDMENIIPEHCVFATNTSAIPITKIAEASKRPEKVVGMHYFSPVEKMQLIEVIKTDQTSTEALQTAVEVGLKQGKIPITVRDSPGFYTSRVISAWMSEAYRLVLEGAGPETVDNTALQLGFPIGPIVLADEVGFDVGRKVYQKLIEAFGKRFETIPEYFLGDIIEAGFLGRKSGRGYYIYTKDSKTVNTELMKLQEKNRLQPKMELTDEAIKDRQVLKFINEACLCLQESVVSNPLEADIGAVFGIGFPPMTGGPFHYIDAVGADKIVKKMKEIEEHYGEGYTPSQILLDYDKGSKKFFN